MSYLDQLLKSVFPDKKTIKEKLSEKLVNEVIKRNSYFVASYEEWLEADRLAEMLSGIKENYAIRYSNAEADVNMQLYQSNLANGFYFKAETDWENEDYSFLIHYLISRLKEKDYFLNNSYREAVEENGQLKTTECFYLKAKLKFRYELPYNQLYGNVMIEHHQLETETNYVKLMVNSYNDSNFLPALNYDELIDYLLT